MLQPKRTKFRKQQKGRNRGLAHVGNRVSFGEFGLKATTHGFVTARQIEAARRAITRFVKRGGKLWIDQKHVRRSRFQTRISEIHRLHHGWQLAGHPRQPGNGSC